MSVRKKIIIVIAAIIVVITLGVVTVSMFYSNTNIPDEVVETNSVSGSDVNENLNMAQGTSSVVVEELNENQPSDDEYSSNDVQQNDEEINFGTTSGNQYDFSDERILANINQEQIRQTSLDFIRGFLTYNADTLKTNSYKPAWVNFVTITDQSGDLIKQRMNDTWTANVSTYPAIYSVVTDAQVDDIYVSHNTHDNIIAVSLTCIIDENQGEPGEMDWEIVNTNKVHYAIYFNSDLRIVDVRRQDAQTINTNIFNMQEPGIIQ